MQYGWGKESHPMFNWGGDTNLAAAQGPVYRNSFMKGNRLVIEFDHADGLRTADGFAPKGFWVAGRDKIWLPALAYQ
jgi:hypothetical protein